MMKLLDHALTSPSGFGGQHIMIQKHQKEAICAFDQWGRPHCAEYAGDGGIKRRDERKRDPDYGRVFGTMYQPEISSV